VWLGSWQCISDGTLVQVDYDDTTITQNTRASYPMEHITNARIPCTGPHPNNIVLLCCDAFGVLPPVARLSRAQTMYHFVSGYTAKVAGTGEVFRFVQCARE
jgi:phosphoenolpyruvate carboxykinase (ATP)